MIYTNQNIVIKSGFLLLLSILTGCSGIDSRNSNINIPAIPEIQRQPVVTPKKTTKAVITSKIETQKQVTQPIKKTIQRVQPRLTEEQQIEANLKAQQLRMAKATRDIDPFATVPETSSSSKTATSITTEPSSTNASIGSPAVQSLMISARADIAIGKSRSAVSKLERGLRIEPENAQLWHMLARAHYTNSAYLHSISIAKKSNALTNNDDLKKDNWNLIKQAGERSGNATVTKEALDYLKVNP